MSEAEICFDVPGSQYNEILFLNKYGDQYSLILGRRSKDGGTNYKQWCFMQGADKKPRDKAIPVKVPLGNVKEAAGLIGEIYSQLCQLAGIKPKVVEDSDIPF